MAKTYETQYGIGLRDEASTTIGNIQTKLRDLNKALKDVSIGSQTFNDLKREINQTESALNRAKEGIGRYGREQNTLKEFIRAERMEQRQQSFMFNQLKDVAGTAAIALSVLGNTGGESMKKLSSSLNQGFVTFQGLDFLLKGLPGPWGAVIGVIGGLGAALFSFTSETADAKKELADLDLQLVEIGVRMGRLTKEAKINALEAAFAAANLKLIETQNATRNTIGIFERLFSMVSGKAVAGGYGIIYDMLFGPSEKDRKAAELQLLKTDEAFNKFFTDISKSSDKAVKTGTLITLKEFVVTADRIAPNTTKNVKKLESALGMSNAELVKLKEGFTGLVEEEVRGAEQMAVFQGAAQSGFAAVGQAIDVGFSQKFQKVFGEANSLLEIFIQNFLAELMRVAASKVFSLMLNFIAPGAGGLFSLFGFHEGGVVPKAHGGMYVDAPPSQEFPIIVRGGETIRTEKQEAVLQRPTININIYGPIADEEAFKRIVESGMRKAGLSSVTDYFRNTRGSLALG